LTIPLQEKRGGREGGRTPKGKKTGKKALSWICSSFLTTISFARKRKKEKKKGKPREGKGGVQYSCLSHLADTKGGKKKKEGGGFYGERGKRKAAALPDYGFFGLMSTKLPREKKKREKEDLAKKKRG